SVATVIQQIKHGEPFERMLAIRGIAQELRGQAELEQVFPHVMEATKDESDIVRDAAASVLPIFVGGSDRPIAPPKPEPDAALLARCKKVENALLALLKTKPRTRGCDLQLVPSLTDVTSIPKEGKNRIIIADVNHVLYFRVFGGDGKLVVDLDERR